MKRTASLAALAACLATASLAVADSNPYIGQVQITGANFCPRGWLPMDGQILGVHGNTALFGIFGTYYGGNGRTTFGLPDLRGNTAIGAGTLPGGDTYLLGKSGGAYNTHLSWPHLPAHTHTVLAATGDPSTNDPDNHAIPTIPAAANRLIYSTATDAENLVAMAEGIIRPTTGGHDVVDIVQPSLSLMHCVAVQGRMPERSTAAEEETQ